MFIPALFVFYWHRILSPVLQKTKILVSKETVGLRWWEIETEIYFIKRVDKGQIATVKDLESWRFER